MKVQILVDNPKSWYVKYAQMLIHELIEDFEISLIHNHDEVQMGDVLCLVSCEKKFSNLHLNRNNIVVHESALPQGKGWSPLTWQILEGKNSIPITLFEAVDEIDAGPIYLSEIIEFDGTELLNELKEKQGIATNRLIKKYLTNYENIVGTPQQGVSTFYKRRTPNDSELDINDTILNQFNLLRVCDNQAYPAFFVYRGKKYILKIYEG